MKVRIPRATAVKQNSSSQTGVQFIKSEVKLTISLLVSNRIDTIRKCLDSVLPILNAIPSELILVDTIGDEKSDGSLAVAREYTDKIIHFDWCNDFAAARNAGLSIAKGEWFLYLDDDEWFDDVTEIINYLQNDDGYYNFFQYRQRNYNDYDAIDYTDSYVGRFVRRTAQTAFSDKIHEYLANIYEPMKVLDCYVHHFGYIYASEEEKMVHSKRNIVPLLEMLDERPDYLRAMVQLIQEYASMHQLGKAMAVCERLMSHLDKSDDRNKLSWGAAKYIELKIAVGMGSDAVEKADEWLECPSISDLAKSNICFTLHRVETAILKTSAMQKYAERYFSLMDHFKLHPDCLDQQQILSLDQFISENNQKYYLLTLLQKTVNEGLWDNAWFFVERILSYGQSELDLQKTALEFMTRAAIHLNRLSDLYARLKANFDHEEWLDVFFNTCEAELSKDGLDAWEVIRFLSALPHPDKAYVILQKIKLAEHDGEADNLPALIADYSHSNVNEIPCHELIKIAQSHSLDLASIITEIDAKTWERSAAILKNTLDEQAVASMTDYIRSVWGIDAPETLFFEAITAYKTVTDESSDKDQFLQEFSRYSHCLYGYYKAIYNPDHFTEQKCRYLSDEAHAAYYLGLAQEAEEAGNEAERLKWLRMGLKYDKELSKPIQRIMDDINDRMAPPSPTVSIEFNMLAMKIKATVIDLIKAKDFSTAKQILDQLSAIVPNDPQVKDLYAQLEMS